MSKLITLLAVVLIAQVPSTTFAKNKVIGVSLLTLQHQFYQDLKAGLEKEAQKNGYELIVTAGEFDAAKQANQLDDFIVKKVDAIVVAPCDSAGIGASIEQANRAKIPVFTADIASSSATGKVVSHIASNNYLGGKKAGELILKALDGQGDVVLITHPGVTSVIDRVRGFKDAVAGAKGIRILGEIPAWGQRAKAASVMEDMLVKLPNIKGVFGINDDSALGALASVEAAGKAGKIAIVGYDATPEARQAIKKGTLYGDTIQYPGKIGEITMQAVRDHFAGKKTPAVIPVEVGVFTSADAK